ncbi:MAG: hypothetical protein ABI193_16215 [Minicystis sp.]
MTTGAGITGDRALLVEPAAAGNGKRDGADFEDTGAGIRGAFASLRPGEGAGGISALGGTARCIGGGGADGTGNGRGGAAGAGIEGGRAGGGAGSEGDFLRGGAGGGNAPARGRGTPAGGGGGGKLDGGGALRGGGGGKLDGTRSIETEIEYSGDSDEGGAAAARDGGAGGDIVPPVIWVARSAAVLKSWSARVSALTSEACSAARRSHFKASTCSPRPQSAAAVESAQWTSSSSS